MNSYLIAISTGLFCVASSTMTAAAGVPPGATGAGAVSDDSSDEVIIVEGERPTYGVSSISTATKTDTPVKDIPQSVTVITAAQMEDQVFRSVSELLYFVAGATPGTGEGNRDQLTLRGNNTSADFFRDGVRDDVQYFRDFYNVERVEVLKGPNAMIFGRGGGGGVLNRVTKRSRLGSSRDFAIISDSEAGVRVTADVDQPLGTGVGLRVNGMYEKGQSFRRHVDLKRYAINPTLGWALGPNTRVDLSYEYFNDRRTADRGVPSTEGRPLEGFDRTFFGDPDKSFSTADVQLSSLAAEHRFSDRLTLRSRTLYADYDKFYQNVYSGSAVTPAGSVTLTAYDDTTKRRNLFNQSDLVWKNRIADVDQTWLFGFELGGSKGSNQRRNGIFSETGTGSVARPRGAATVSVPVSFVANGNNAGVKTQVSAIYAQGQFRPTDLLEIVAGLRHDRIAVEVDNRTTGADFDRTDALWSPRLGLILKPLEDLSVYTSYSRSYLPQSGDQFNSMSLTTEALKPERFDNYELGAKWEPIAGLLATASVYQLDRSNVQARDPEDPALTVLAGAQRARGVELGIERSISDRWLISAGYSFQDAEITEATGTSTVIPEGRKVPLVPKHGLSLWNRYQVTDRLGVGAGLVARSKSYASFSNSVELPKYARVDAAVFYELRKGIEAQLNVENLFGTHYFPTAHNDNNIAPGAPFTAKGALRFAF